MRADDILQAGAQLLVQRGIDRDQPGGERTMSAAVAALNALTGLGMTEQHGWLLMVLLKMRRAQTGRADADHYVDGANYVALMGEAALAAARPVAASMYGAAKATPDAMPCRACEGTGNCAIDRRNRYTRCPVCGGSGRRPAAPPTVAESATVAPPAEPARGPYTLDPDGTLSGPAGTHNIYEVPEGCCPICCGTGRTCDDGDDLCPTCGGTGAD